MRTRDCLLVSLVRRSRLLLASALVCGFSLSAWAQQVNPNVGLPYYQRSVGGISINADGLLDNASADAQGKLAQLWAAGLAKIPADSRAVVPLRKVSLVRLEAATNDCLKAGKPLSDELMFLGGLQEIRYVFAYPQQHDIVLLGPAEGWKIGPRGDVVGVTTGKPVMLLDDLLVALRTARNSAQAGITCSIDPTPEGIQRLKTHVSKLRTLIGNPAATGAGIEEALGKQQITFSGVPATSHFARILIGADYRMKRIAMEFEPAPIRELPGFLHMIGASGRGMSNMMPRWWLEPRYESLLHDGDGMAWELRGGSVKCMTEEDFLTAAGSREHTGKPSVAAQKWADKMTEHYPQLAVAEPIFGELRNCMELAVVAALIVRGNLMEKADCSLPVLLDSASLKTKELPAPKQVDSRASMLKKGQNWVISASGGVAIYAAGIVAKAEQSDAPAAIRAKAGTAHGANWWWN